VRDDLLSLDPHQLMTGRHQQALLPLRLALHQFVDIPTAHHSIFGGIDRQDDEWLFVLVDHLGKRTDSGGFTRAAMPTQEDTTQTGNDVGQL